jgi:zinc transport system permease protein
MSANLQTARINITPKPEKKPMVDWNDFLILALVNISLISLLSGAMGCLLVWRRMAYFSETMAHSALLGITFSLMLEISMTLGILSVALFSSLIIALSESQKKLASDTVLGILSHVTLAIGMILYALQTDIRMDITSFLFGDILAMGPNQALGVMAVTPVILGLLFWIWKDMLRITLDADLAQVEGVKVQRLRLLYTLMLALVIALGIQSVGILLITALLIIPAATARIFAQTPSQMALGATAISLLTGWLGIGLSYQFNLPTGPAIVVAAGGFFLLASLVGFKRAK